MISRRFVLLLAFGLAALVAALGYFGYQKYRGAGAVNPYVQPALPAGYRPTLEIPMPPVPPGDGKTVLYPSTPSPFVLVKTDLWNLKTGEKIATVPGNEAFRSCDAVSADGKIVAAEKDGAVQVLSTTTGQKILEVPYDNSKGNLVFVDFAGTDRLVLAVPTPPTCRVEVWDLAAGKQVVHFTTERFDMNGGAVSLDGASLAAFTVDQLKLLDLQSGKTLWTWTTPRGKFKGLLVASGISFSPDGKELAVFCGMGDEHQLLVWNTADGRLTGEYTFPALTGGIFNTGKAVQWFPGGDAWIIQAQCLLHRPSGRIVWMLQTEMLGLRSTGILDRDHLLAPRTKGEQVYLVSVPVPWPEIDTAVTAMRSPDTAPLRPKGSVQVQIDISNLHLGDPEQLKSALTEALTQRLAVDDVAVGADEKATIVYAKYSEVSGRTLQVFEMGGFQPKRPTGQTAEETKMALEVGFRLSGAKEPLWQAFITQEAGLFISGKGTTQDLHKDTLDGLKRRLRGLPIPYFLLQDGKTRLPIVSQL